MKFRAICAAFLACVVSAAIAQDTSAKVTYSTVAVLASRALEELSKLSGVRLTATPMTASEILVINVKDATLNDVMKRIANVTAASWKEESGGYALVPNTLLRNQQARDEQAAHAKKLAKTLQQRFDALAKAPNFDAKSAAKLTGGDDETDPEEAAMAGMGARFGFGGGGSPIDRAITRLIQGIGVNALTGIPKDARIVFSSNPTRMQRPFGSGAINVLQTLVREQNVYAEAVGRANQTKPADTEQTKAIEKMMEMFGGGGDEVKPIKTAPSKAILIATRQLFFDGLTLELKVFDTNGAQLIHGSATVMDQDFSQFMPGEKPGAKEEQPPKDDKAIEFSATTVEMQGSLGKFTQAGGLESKLSPELTTKLKRPDLYDPLSFTHSEGLIQSAAAKGEQLVANLPDSMQSFFGMVMGGDQKPTVWSFLNGLKKGDEVTVLEADGWLEIAPKSPVESREHRLDRAALAKLIEASAGKEFASLDDIAAYSLKNESPMNSPVSMMYIMLYAPSAMQQGFDGMVNWNMMRLYGTLNQAQRQSLTQGSRVQFGTLSQQQRDLMTKILFGADADLQIESEAAKKDDGLGFMSMFRRMFGGGKGGDYRTEPTEIMPNGLPSDGYILVNVRKTHVAKVAGASAGNNPLGSAPMGADELAMLKAFKEDPNMSQMAGFIPTIEEVRLGTRTIYGFKFYVAPSVLMEQSLNDNELKKDAPATKFANLPADFQKEINDRMVAMKKLPFFDPSILMGARGKNIPPRS